VANQPGKTWIAFLPTVLIDFTLPVLLLLGIPALISTKSVPGLPYWSGWTFITYILPDIGYSLLGIASLFLTIGFVKLFWLIQLENRRKAYHE
jgi:hypothetical protein